MVDISPKPTTPRTAVATGKVHFSSPSLPLLIDTHSLSKGNVLTTAQIAGIQAAKRTAELIPLCHQVSLSRVVVELTTRAAREDAAAGVDIVAVASTTAGTGVEMEALVAVSAAALTVYDMCKAVDKGMRIGEVGVVYKVGGRSGKFLDEGEESRDVVRGLVERGILEGERG